MKTDELGAQILVAVKTPEGQAAIKTFAEVCNDIWQKAEACSKTYDWSKIPPEGLIKLRVEGLEKQLEIVMSVPEDLRQFATVGNCKLFWMLSILLTEAEPFDKLQDDIALIQIGRRCNEEIVRRELENPTGLRLLQLKAQQDYGIPPVEKDESGNVESYVLKKLLDDLRPTARFWLPQEAKSHQPEAKDEISQETITEILNKLRAVDWKDVLVQVIAGKLEDLGKAAEYDLIGELRKQTKKREIPSDRLQSLDVEIHLDDGDTIPLADTIGETNIDIEFIEELTASQKEKLRNLLGKTAFRVFEFQYEYYRLNREEAPISAIKKQLGYVKETISRARRKIKENREEIEKILSG